MGIQTVMNLIGPLANPAMAGRQVIGVADPARLELIAGALAELGTVHSLVVHGAPGLDEISPVGPTTVIELRGSQMSRSEFRLEDVGLAPAKAADLAGGEPAQNAEIVERVLLGKAPAGAEAAVVLNAGAAIYVAGKAKDLAAGVTLAREALKAGAGWDALGRLRRASASRR
jgi:anthranilate phosphoribosyltransferase